MIGRTPLDHLIKGPPPRHCFCCSERWGGMGDCVQGPRCQCVLKSCYVCHKCITHCTCPDGPERNLSSAMVKLLAALQPKQQGGQQ